MGSSSHDELQTRYNEKLMSLNRMLEGKDVLHRAFFEEMRKLQRAALEHIEMVLAKQERLNMELENKKKRLSSWGKQLRKRDPLTERGRQKLKEEKQKNDLMINDLQLTSEEKRKADEKVLREVEEDVAMSNIRKGFPHVLCKL